NRPSDDFDCEFYVNEDESYTTSKDHRNALLKLMEISKVWLNNKQRPLVYMGNSRTTRWRREVFFKKAALQMPTLETFFGVTREKISVNKASIIESLEECEFEDIDEIDENEEQEKDSLKNRNCRPSKRYSITKLTCSQTTPSGYVLIS
ncbi:18775_t:CDS:1, partial [Racocetra persica]